MLMQELKGAKMNWKNRLTNYNFWISIFSAVLLILQALKIEFDIAYVNEIFTAVLGLLVVIGIISDPTRTTVKTTENACLPTGEAKQMVANEKTEEVLEEKQVDVNQNALPIEEENEINNVNLENDLQTILTKISTNLDEKMKEMVQFNVETLNKIHQKQTEIIPTLEEIKDETQIQKTSTEAEPAVAEMSNPFVDVIN